MKLRIKTWLVAGCVSASLAGCQEPKEIIPVAPPGLELSRIPATKPGEGAQAIGEQAIATPSTKQNTVKTSSAGSPPTPVGQPTTTASGLTYETLVAGTGEIAQSGQTVTMHYTGTLTNGKVFDSSREKNRPFVVAIGVGRVIGGWDEGVPGMKVGERRKLTIPPELGYGPAGSPPDIPGNATLVFDVELLEVK